MLWLHKGEVLSYPWGSQDTWVRSKRTKEEGQASQAEGTIERLTIKPQAFAGREGI